MPYVCQKYPPFLEVFILHLTFTGTFSFLIILLLPYLTVPLVVNRRYFGKRSKGVGNSYVLGFRAQTCKIYE